MSDQSQITLFELYDPILQLFSVIQSYENVLDQVSKLEKERASKQWIIDKVIEYDKNMKALQNEKQLVDEIYNRSSLSQELTNTLINQEQPIDNAFLLAFQALQEQERLQYTLKDSDQVDQSTPLQKSFVKNIQEIKSLACAKIQKNLHNNYYQFSPDIIGRFYTIMHSFENFKAIFIDQVNFCQKQNFQTSLNVSSNQLQSQSEEGLEKVIISSLNLFQEKVNEQKEQLIKIFGQDQSQFRISLRFIIDDTVVQFLQKVDTALGRIKDYYQMFNILEDLQNIIQYFENDQQFSYKEEKFSFFAILQKLKNQSDGFLQRTLAILQHTLQSTRFNISVWSSYQPIEEHFIQARQLLYRIDENRYQIQLETLIKPLWQLVIQKLQHNEENRSSKIFSLNTLSIIMNFLADMKKYKLKDDQLYEKTIVLIEEQQKMIQSKIDELILKTSTENLEDVITKIKMDQLKIKNINFNNDKELKESARKILIAFIKLDTEINKKELFFEIEFIRDLDIQFQIKQQIIEQLMNLYTNYFTLLTKYSEKIGLKLLEEESASVKLIHNLAVTNKDAPRKDYYKIKDPETIKLELMNVSQ